MLFNRMTEPALRPIRRAMPNLGTLLDISPVILLIGLYFLRNVVIIGHAHTAGGLT